MLCNMVLVGCSLYPFYQIRILLHPYISADLRKIIIYVYSLLFVFFCLPVAAFSIIHNAAQLAIPDAYCPLIALLAYAEDCLFVADPAKKSCKIRLDKAGFQCALERPHLSSLGSDGKQCMRVAV